MKVVPNRPRSRCRPRARLRAAALVAISLALLAPRAYAGNVTWTLAGAGDWDTAANWSSNPNLPGTTDNVTNNTSYTITHSTGNDTIASLTTNGELDLTGGNLTVNGALQANNELYLGGGELSGAAVSLGTTGSLVFANSANNNLNGVTLPGSLNLTAPAYDQGGWAHLTGGTTLGSNPTITLGGGSLLSFDNSTSETLAGATIYLESGQYTTSSFAVCIEGGETLTLGPTTTVTVNWHGSIGGAYYTPGNSTLVNNGAMTVGESIDLGNGEGTGGAITNMVNGAGATISTGLEGSITINPVNFTNSGSISASSAGSITIAPTNPWVAGGTIKATGGDMDHGNSLVTLGGTFTIPASAPAVFSTSSYYAWIGLTGTMDLTGDVPGSATSFDPTAGGTDNFEIAGGEINGGGVGTVKHSFSLVFSNNSDNGQDNVLNGVALDSGLDLALQAYPNDGGWAHLTGGTTLGTNPTIVLGNYSALDFDNSRTDTLAGATINIQQGVEGQADEIDIDGGETLVLGPSTVLTASGTGSPTYIAGSNYTPGTSTLVNNGTIAVTNGAGLGIGGGTINPGSPLTNLTNGAGALMSASGTGTIAGSTYVSELGVYSTNFTNMGEILAVNGGKVYINPTNPFVNQGTVDAEAGSTITLFSYSQSAGRLIANGTVAQSSGTINISGGTVTGGGTIQGSLSNTGGVVSAGSSIGTLTVTGNYAQGSSGTLVANIGGETAGTGYSVMAITGSAALGGTIDVDFVNGFTPKIGDTFDIMTYGSVTGDFALVAPEGFSNIQVNVLPNFVQVEVTPGPESLLVLALGLSAAPLALRRRASSRRAE
jgi:hypothetical protein